MATGEAHWQNGMVERHIGTFRELFSKLLLEDAFERCDPSIDRGPRLRSKAPEWLLHWHLAEPVVPWTLPTPLDRHRRGFSSTFARV